MGNGRVLALALLAVVAGGCASIDVGLLTNAHRAMFARKPYVDYTGPDAARIRVVYGRGWADIWVNPDSTAKQGFSVPQGERINKRWMGTMSDWTPISLGMPGNPPSANYTEIAVAPGVPVTLSFSWQSSNMHRHSNCSVDADLLPVARGNYETRFEMDFGSGLCRAIGRAL